MDTISTFNSGVLTIAIKGRVDGTEAPKLQENLNACLEQESEVEEVVIDASEMEFISSMGLRALLQLRQKQENLRIIECSEDIYNVFRMTGFTKIFTVEKAWAQMSIEGLEEVPGLPDTYKLTDETMLKVFPEGTTKEEVGQEIAKAKEAMVMGIPTAMPFEKGMVGKRFALIYENIAPQEIDAKTLAKFVRNMHEQLVEPDGAFPDGVDIEKQQIASLKPYLGDEAVTKLRQMLLAVPEGSSLLHGNICPQTIMCTNGEPIMLSMKEACYGNPFLDLAHFYSAMPEEFRATYFVEFLDEYYDQETDDIYERNRTNIVTLSLIRDFTRLTQYGEPTEEAVTQAQKDFKERVIDHWDEILSHLRFKMDFAEEIRRLERKRFYLDFDVDIDWVAYKLGTNRHYVSDYFNKVLHTSFNDYINNMRLDYAVKLIRAGKVAPAKIAYEAGFNNDHTFRRLFKQRFGCTPSQFEKE